MFGVNTAAVGTGRNAWCLRTENKGSVRDSELCHNRLVEKSELPMLKGMGTVTSCTAQVRMVLWSPSGGLRMESRPTGIRYT